MKKQQQHVVESFTRIRVFVRALPAPDEPALAVATESLDRALARLRDVVPTRDSKRDACRFEILPAVGR